MPLTPGTRLGPYEIASPVGSGGMGEVYKAYDTRLRHVGVKTSAERFSDRFEREARASNAGMMAVAIHGGPGMTAGQPQRLFQYSFRSVVVQNNQFHYAPSADGRRFLVVVATDDGRPTLNLVTDWRRLLSTVSPALR